MELQKEQIERQFDRAATTYDSVAALQRQMADRLLEELPAQLDGTLIDLGCGTGDLLQKLANRMDPSKLTGLDLSSAMLGQTANRVPQARLVKADLANVPFDDDSFAWITSNAAIQWCDSSVVFSEMRRLLQPTGQAFVSTFGPRTMHQWRDTMANVGSNNERIHTFKPVEQLSDEMKEAGFSTVDQKTETIDTYFDSVQAMFDSVRKLGATNARRDRSIGLSGRRWFEQVTKAFEQRRNADGKLCLTYECCYLFAR